MYRIFPTDPGSRARTAQHEPVVVRPASVREEVGGKVGSQQLEDGSPGEYNRSTQCAEGGMPLHASVFFCVLAVTALHVGNEPWAL
jgi:hypothetical protein